MHRFGHGITDKKAHVHLDIFSAIYFYRPLTENEPPELRLPA